jgi:c-di-GMP-binding flagellar brake protein YcgR
MIERRQLPRWEIKKEAKVWMSPMFNSMHCIIEDMHLKGMCISFSRRLPPLETVKMSFTIGNDSDLIKIEARIVWVREDQDLYKYGLSFNRIDDEDKDRIYQYINNNCAEQFSNNRWA